MTTENALANCHEDVEDDDENNNSSWLRRAHYAPTLYQVWYLIWPSQQICKVGIFYLHLEDEKTKAEGGQVTFPRSQS